MLRSLIFGIALVACAVLVQRNATAAIIPELQDVKWQASTIGFGGLKDAGVLGDTSGVLLRSLAQIDAPLNNEGVQPVIPAPFVVADEPGGAAFTATAYRSILLTTGLKVIGIHHEESGLGPFDYSFHSGAAVDDLSDPIYASLTGFDVLYFGAEVGVTPKGLLYEDVAANNASGAVVSGNVNPSNGWTATGAGFTGGHDPAATPFTIAAGVDALALELEFQDLSGAFSTRVDGVASVVSPTIGPLFAPLGTLLIQALDPLQANRPIVLLDVVGGVEFHKVLQDAMFTILTTSGGPTLRVADAIGSIGSQLTPIPAGAGGGALTGAGFTDPIEFVTTPEPTSFAIWGLGAGLVGLVAARRRRRKAA